MSFDKHTPLDQIPDRRREYVDVVPGVQRGFFVGLFWATIACLPFWVGMVIGLYFIIR